MPSRALELEDRNGTASTGSMSTDATSPVSPPPEVSLYGGPEEKLCECGCGEPTPLATRTRPYLGLVKNEPLRYIRGHSGRGKRSQFCRNGHDKNATGRCPNGACRVCARARQRAWDRANPRKVRSSQREWRQANPQKVRAAEIKRLEDGRKSLYSYRYSLKKRKEALMRDIEASGYTMEGIRSV